MGAIPGFKCRHVLLTENLRGRINDMCMCKHDFELVVLSWIFSGELGKD